jgi:hypothetical protein
LVDVSGSAMTFKATTNNNTIIVNSAAQPLNVVSQAGIAVSGSSGTQKIVSGSFSGLDKASYSVDFGTAEIRHFAASGYFQTFYSNGIESLRLASSGAILVNGSAGTSGQVLTSSGGTSAPTWKTQTIRSIITTQVVSTDANITAAAGTSYFVPASTFTANRTIDVSALNEDNDYIEIYCDNQSFTLSFAGAPVYYADNVTIATTLFLNGHYQIRRKNGRIYIIGG